MLWVAMYISRVDMVSYQYRLTFSSLLCTGIEGQIDVDENMRDGGNAVVFIPVWSSRGV